MSARPVVLDVDTGVDDALAILLALGSPEFAVQGICTVSGNVSLLQTTANTCRVLDVAGAQAIPVVAGAGAPAVRPGFTAGEVHGGDGLGGMADRFPAPDRAVRRDAPGFLLETIRRFPGELTLIATGPLTNAAQAIQRDVETMRRLRALTVMGVASGARKRRPGLGVQLCGGPRGGCRRPWRRATCDAGPAACHGTSHADAPGRGRGGFRRRRGRVRAPDHGGHHGVSSPALRGGGGSSSTIRSRWASPWIRSRPAGTHGGGDRDPGTLTAGMTVADLRRGSYAVPTAQVCLEVDADRFLGLFTQRVLR